MQKPRLSYHRMLVLHEMESSDRKKDSAEKARITAPLTIPRMQSRSAKRERRRSSPAALSPRGCKEYPVDIVLSDQALPKGGTAFNPWHFSSASLLQSSNRVFETSDRFATQDLPDDQDCIFQLDDLEELIAPGLNLSTSIHTSMPVVKKPKSPQKSKKKTLAKLLHSPRQKHRRRAATMDTGDSAKEVPSIAPRRQERADKDKGDDWEADLTTIQQCLDGKKIGTHDKMSLVDTY